MRHDLTVSQQPLSRVSGSLLEPANARTALRAAVRCVSGRSDIVALQPALAQLCRQTGQDGAMDWLDSFLDSPDSRRKIPHLVLVGAAAAHASSGRIHALAAHPAESRLSGALLIYEYRVAGLGTGVFATDDIYGTRTVISSPESRLPVAQAAITHLVRSKAAVAFASIDCDRTAPAEPAWRLDDVHIAMRTRLLPSFLPLAPTLDDTFAGFGTRTRRNLRCYRRRAAAELGAQFVPEAHLTAEEFLALNNASTHPMSTEAALWRYRLLERSARNPATLYAGLRSASGQWLSVVWGRRENDVTRLLWQINRSGSARHSFCAAMRGFLLENEIALGNRELQFIGGTHRSMHAAFGDAAITDLLAVRRDSVRGIALRRFAQQLLPPSNFLRHALEDEHLVWLENAA